MNWRLFVLAIILAVLVIDVLAIEKPRKHKKFRKHRKIAATSTEAADSSAEGQDEFKMMEQDDAEEQQLREAEEKAKALELERENEKAREAAQSPVEEPGLGIRDNRVPIPDPCAKVHCGAGRVCDINKEGEPHCVCIPDCPVESDSRRKVCSNHNETWTSDCAVYQQRCWCDTGDSRCRGDEFAHMHIEYYGECREMPECSKEEMADFPRRMRDWLFNIMRDLADRQELTPHYLKMEREAETNMTRRWTNAAIWKWCDLDGHPPDRSVSRHELFPIRAPLMSLEHCIAPFLNSCDVDDNHRISLKEWGTCLELEEEDLEDKCDELLLG